MISKELLSEVLGYEIEIRGFRDKYIPSNFEYIKDMVDVKIINIFELAYKCKEWALNKGYYISSNIYDNNGCCQLFKDNSSVCNECGEIESLEHFHSSCESGAIFKACQWILDNKKEGS